jgi:hypothetical protein
LTVTLNVAVPVPPDVLVALQVTNVVPTGNTVAPGAGSDVTVTTVAGVPGPTGALHVTASVVSLKSDAEGVGLNVTAVPVGLLATTSADGVTTGGGSVTVTTNDAVPGSPTLFVAVQLTVVVPRTNVVPDS